MSGCVYISRVVLISAWPSLWDTLATSAPLVIAMLAKLCPYGIIRTNRKTLAVQWVDWFVLILFPLKTALKWGLREGVKNLSCT